MHRKLALLLALVAPVYSAASHADPLAIEFKLGGDDRAVKVAYINNTVAATGESEGELKFYWASSSKPFQVANALVTIEKPWFETHDLNGDGYTDVVFYNSPAGYGGSPSRGADVYLFIPKLGRFVKSKTLSERGDVRPSSQRGCSDIEYKSGPTGYTTEKWCFNLSTGRWKLVASSGGEAE